MNGLKRTISLLLSTVLLFSLSGCAAEESTSQVQQAAGRWAEQEITPEQGLYQLGFAADADGTLYWYGTDPNAVQEWQVRCFVSQDNGQTWQEEQLSWQEQISGTITGVSRASDGTLLVTSYGVEGGTQTGWLISADGTSRQLCFDIPEEATIQRVDLMSAERAFLTLEVPMEGEGYSVQATDVNGQATAARMISPSESGVFDLTTGQKVNGESTEYPQFLISAEAGGTLYVMNFDGERQTYQLQSVDESGALTMLHENLSDITGNAALAVRADGTSYFADVRGVHRLAQGGSKLETILEAGAFTLALPGRTIHTLLVLDDGSFAVAMSDMEGSNYQSRIYRYYEDDSLPAPSEDNTLNVWSLYNSDTARAAAVQFGTENPSLNVQYTYALEDGDAAGVEDVLRQLNTELLAGNGPDVLILDGVDDYASYIQKGVFADLSGAIDETALVPSVGQAFLQDGEVCVFPARFQVPVLFGDAGSVEKLTSLDALRSEVHQWAPRPDVTVEDESYYTPLDDAHAYAFSFLDLEKLVDFALQTSMSAILTDEGIDGDALYQVLDLIADIGGYYGMDEYSENPTENSTAGGSGGDVVIASDELQEYTNSDRARFGRTLMSTPLVIPSNGGRYIGGILSGTFEQSEFNVVLQPGLCEGAFIPTCMVAVNAGSTQQQPALEYVRTLLSEKIQSTLYEDEGMPVNQAALDASLSRAQQANDWELYQGDFGELLAGLKTPVRINTTVKQYILEYAKDLCAGTLSVEDAVAELTNELSLYLAERQ